MWPSLRRTPARHPHHTLLALAFYDSQHATSQNEQFCTPPWTPPYKHSPNSRPVEAGSGAYLGGSRHWNPCTSRYYMMLPRSSCSRHSLGTRRRLEAFPTIQTGDELEGIAMHKRRRRRVCVELTRIRTLNKPTHTKETHIPVIKETLDGVQTGDITRKLSSLIPADASASIAGVSGRRKSPSVESRYASKYAPTSV